jgi:bacterioferritin
MKGDPKVIELLNEALKAELTAINQYWLHYRMLDNWGVKKLAEFERHESIDEMKHADRFAERILFLEGLPNFQALGRLRIGESVEEILKADLDAEHEAVEMYRNGVAYCEKRRDYVSRDLFADVLATRKAMSTPRNPVRDDQADGPSELHSVAVGARRRVAFTLRGARMATTSPQRIHTLDIVRGVAVMGILAMNIVAFAMPIQAYFNPLAYGAGSASTWPSMRSTSSWSTARCAASSPFLFGASMLLVIEASRSQGRIAASVTYRRQLWLLVFGAIHFYLIWFGDIL